MFLQWSCSKEYFQMFHSVDHFCVVVSCVPWLKGGENPGISRLPPNSAVSSTDFLLFYEAALYIIFCRSYETAGMTDWKT